MDESAPVEEDANTSNPPENNDENVKQPTKRKRQPSRSPKKILKQLDEDDDDGQTCPICLDQWEISGTHRLTSLKCGHLFGHSCIQRWVKECASSSKCCPQCKSKATNKDFRFIYAKRVLALDRTKEIALENKLKDLTKEHQVLEESNRVLKLDLNVQKSVVARLQDQLSKATTVGMFDIRASTSAMNKSYKLFMHNNIELSSENGCRVLAVNDKTNILIASQRSSTPMFPGFGVRMLDMSTLRLVHYMPICPKEIRSIALNTDGNILASVSLEKIATIVNLNSKSYVATVEVPQGVPLWSCEFRIENPMHFYLGTQFGTVYEYDMRYNTVPYASTKSVIDNTAVLSICSIPRNQHLPAGGLLVCKLKSIWVYDLSENIDSNTNCFKLNVEGPFMSAKYDAVSENVLISTRTTEKFGRERHIVGQLQRLDNVIIFEWTEQFEGSSTYKRMTRSTLVRLEDRSIVGAYLQDRSMLKTWDLKNTKCHMSVSCTDMIFDLCPIYSGTAEPMMAALSDNRCRIYKFLP